MVNRSVRTLARKGLALFRTFAPGETAWRGAASTIWLLALAFAVTLAISEVLVRFSLEKALAYLVIVGGLLLVGLLLRLGIWLFATLSPRYRAPLIGLLPFLLAMTFLGMSEVAGAALLLGTLVGLGLVGGAGAVLRERGPRHARAWCTWTAVVVGGGILTAGAITLFGPKGPDNPGLAEFALEDRTLPVRDPALPGEHAVTMLTYGSGRDPRRVEYGADVDLRAPTVDGSKLIDGWDGLAGWARTRYWGFDASALPLQGRVWYPEGEGPFPLVLLVHGNHAMEDFSDVGYAYLGELLASRGTIFVSVDENFLNSSVANVVNPIDPGLDEENDARAWLLLEHLRLWRTWNRTSNHHFRAKVDLGRVALIGHSRGGEAVATAATFNQLAHYPDDATLVFDYGFDLRGVVAIAPVDGQYRPRGRRSPLRGVNYFVMHGSMDGDVTSFDGSRVYARAQVGSDDFRFKSSLYVVGANHGQFNTDWGRCDTVPFLCWTLDTRGIIDGDDQRRVAKVYISAFLEVVLNEDLAYLPIFADAPGRMGGRGRRRCHDRRGSRRGRHASASRLEHRGPGQKRPARRTAAESRSPALSPDSGSHEPLAAHAALGRVRAGLSPLPVRALRLRPGQPGAGCIAARGAALHLRPLSARRDCPRRRLRCPSVVRRPGPVAKRGRVRPRRGPPSRGRFRPCACSESP